ncbi:MAG TPA: S1 RNA-binding domain-containing protein, partial [Polyangiaceae bacterium]|nr:S1 RNA-binding domain-containing protein [Polyangiaceae bacterium]
APPQPAGATPGEHEAAAAPVDSTRESSKETGQLATGQLASSSDGPAQVGSAQVESGAAEETPSGDAHSDGSAQVATPQVLNAEHAPRAGVDVAREAPEQRSPERTAVDRGPDASEAPKDPKVPRVILEVGADFIGVVHNDGARGGLVVLTHHPNRAERAKPGIEAAYNEKTPVSGLVTGVIKGGIEVDVDGVRAFAPGSHVDLRLGADLSHLVGRRLSFAVTQYAKRGRDVVLSRKAMLEDEARKVRAEALAKLKVGADLDGVVRSVVPFGAFVDVGGVEGLVPLQEMSHNRADGPSDVFKAGEPTRVRVIKIDDKGKVWLSRKATIPDPWQQVAQKYAMGTRHTGKVARLQPFGAFVELEPGVDGLVHTQDLSIKRIETPADVVKVGDPIEVVVSHIDPSQHKIALHPAPQGDAAAEAPQRVAPHKPVKAKVVNIESGGLVVRILGVTGRNARGYVTAAGTGTPRGTELRKAFNVGQEIEAKVIEMDPRRGEVKLSIKALGEDQERSAYQQYRQQLKAEARFTFGDLLAKKGK